MAVQGKKFLLPCKKLKELKRETAELTEKTGFYAGLEKLWLKESNPSKYELFHGRMLAALIAAREQCKMISASALVREVGELLVTFYTPDGDCVGYSTGIQVHGHLVGEFIKWMIDNDYEDRVGIRPGDVFVHNDGAVAAMHPADVYDVMPLFYRDELIGWVATTIMESDIGEEFMMGDTSWNRTSDGLIICGLKEGENYQLKADVEELYRRSLRNVDMFLLDRRGAISADIRFEQEMVRMVEEFGIDYFRQAIRELIEDERRRISAKVRERLVPGRYRSLTAVDILCADLPVPEYAAKDWLRIMPMEVTISTGGNGTVSYEGIGGWGWHSMNSVLAGQYGGLTISLVQRMSYEGWANKGTVMDWQITAPEGSLISPPRQMLKHMSFANVWVPAITSWGTTFQAILSRGFFSRGFVEEVMLGHGRTGAIGEMMGINPQKQMYVWAPFEIAGAPGLGARGCLDGEDSCYQVWNTETEMGNLEVLELVPPYLNEIAVIPNTGGAGKYRGGNDAVSMFNIYGTDFTMVASVAITCTWISMPNTQIMGGYPGPTPAGFIVRNPREKWAGGRINLKEVALAPWKGVDQVEYLKEKAPVAEVIPVKRMVSRQVKEGDVVINLGFSGNGGLGDPIERDPGLIEKDLRWSITPEMAASVYKAAFTYDRENKTYWVDLEKTEKLREEERENRLKRGSPVQDWWQEQRERVLNKQFSSLLTEAYRSSFEVSRQWAEEFNAFWNLPEDYSF